MSAEIFEVINTQNWDEQITQCNGSLFLHSRFLKAIESEDKKPVFFEFKQNNESIAFVSGVIIPVGKTSSTQLFFFSGIACNFNEEITLRACKKALLKYARQYSFARVIFETYDELNYKRIASNDIIIARDRAEFVIDLKQEKEKIIKGFSPNVRRMARRAREQGAVLKYGQSYELLEKLFSLLEHTHEERKAKGYGSYQIHAFPFLDNKNLLKLLDNKMAHICYIELRGEILCMQYNLVTDNLVYGLLLGTSKNGYTLGAPSMLFYEVTLDYFKKNYIRYNLGGIPMGVKHKGIRKFKQSLGPALVKSNQEFTKFLIRPFSRLNPILTFKDFITNLRIPWRAKKQLLKLADVVLKGTDKY